MYGLQPVANIRQCPLRNGGECISKVALFQRILQLYRFNRGERENCFISHASQVAAAGSGLKAVS